MNSFIKIKKIISKELKKKSRDELLESFAQYAMLSYAVKYTLNANIPNEQKDALFSGCMMALTNGKGNYQDMVKLENKVSKELFEDLQQFVESRKENMN